MPKLSIKLELVSRELNSYASLYRVATDSDVEFKRRAALESTQSQVQANDGQICRNSRKHCTNHWRPVARADKPMMGN
jgi:hypothetical protein